MNLQLLNDHTPKISLLTPPWKFNRGNIYRSLQLFTPHAPLLTGSKVDINRHANVQNMKKADYQIRIWVLMLILRD